MSISAPLRVNVQITNACNQRCAYCYNPNHDPHMMSMEDFTFVSRLLSQLGVFRIYIAGGEPLLHPLLFDFYELVAASAFQPPVILTNGSILSPEIIDGFEKCKRFGPVQIQVSLDSLIPIPGLQDRRIPETVSFIEEMVRLGIVVTIGTVVTSLNIEHVPQIVSRFGASVYSIHLMPPMVLDHNSDWLRGHMPTEEAVNTLMECLRPYASSVMFEGSLFSDELERLEKMGCNSCKGCAAAYSKAIIDPNLNVLACEITPDIVLGNLRQSTFAEIWHGPVAQRVRDEEYPICHDLNLVKKHSTASDLIDLSIRIR